MTFAEYTKLLDDLLDLGMTTGPKQGEEMLHYAKLNRQRMNRLEKTVVLDNAVIDAAQKVNRKMIWLVIAEGWCGDAAQNIPVIEKIAAASANIETRYVLRDENTELIDMFLTNGSRSVPKLIAVEAETLEVLGTWGARPKEAQKLYEELKVLGADKESIMEKLQRWYNADKNQAIQSEFLELLDIWIVMAEVASEKILIAA
jgi:hypothetical protein